MSHRTFLPICAVLLFGLAITTAPRAAHAATPASEIDSIYIALDTGSVSLPSKAVFARAVTGFLSLKKAGRTQSGTVSIIDFTLPSTEKRLWVIDLDKGTVLYHSLVAHGKNSGELYAKEFSNKHESNKSSLGFYLTGKKYNGKHGLSLTLHGLEPGINDQAESRAIVIHGANYVSEEYAKKVGRLGRSWGCPAIPMENHKAIINQIADGSCMFIYYPDQGYLSKSRFAGA